MDGEECIPQGMAKVEATIIVSVTKTTTLLVAVIDYGGDITLNSTSDDDGIRNS